MIRAFVRFLAVGILALPALALAQNAVSDATNLDAPTHKSWPVGPYAQVSTDTGLLQTSVPFFSLKGPGRSSMGFGLYHRSSQANATMAQTQGYAGVGWQPSTMSFVNAGGSGTYLADPYQVVGGNAANHWHVPSFDASGNPSGYVRRPGIRADLARILSGSTLTGFVVTDQASAVKSYYERHDGFQASHWLLTRVVDPRGNQVTYGYDAYNHVTSIQDAAGRTATFSWDASQFGLLNGVSVAAGGQTRTWNLEYWPAGSPSGHYARVRNVLFPPDNAGNRPSVHFEYDANDNVVDILDARGNDWHVSYATAPWGVLVARIYEPSTTPPANYSYGNPPLNSYDPNNPTVFTYFTHPGNYTGGSQDFGTVSGVTFALPSQSFTCAIADRLNKVWRHVYDYGVNAAGQQTGVVNNDWMGNPIRIVAQPPVTDYLGGTNHVYTDLFTWDYNEGTLTRHDDPEARRTDFTYDTSPRDNSGLVNTMTRYVGGNAYTWRYTNWYVANAQPRRVVTRDPDGRRVVTGYNWTYDEAGYVDVDPQSDPYDGSYSKPAGLHVQTNTSYNASGEATDVWTGSDAHAVRSNFDAYGNAQTATDPAGNSTSTTYDAWGNKISATPPSPQGKTTFAYDNLNRLILTTLPDNHTVGASYDLAGNLVSARKEDGTLVTTQYDGLNRPMSVAQPVDGSTTLVTSYGYNLRGERTSVTNPRNKTTYYGVDERGKMILITYPDATTRKIGYDGTGNKVYAVNGRNQKTVYGYDGLNRLTAIDYPNSADVSFQYRIDGVRTQMTDGTGATTYGYDDAGRLRTQAGGLTGKTLTTAYVPGTNRRQSLGDGAQTWTSNYDGGLRLSTIGQTVGSATPVTYGYNPDESILTETFGNGTKTTYGYDGRGRTTSIAHATTGGAAQQTLGYGFGPDGNLQTYTDAYPGVSSWTTSYVHDKADRLTSETRTGGSAGNYAAGYSYDGNGNRLSVTRTGVGSSSTYGTYGDNDQLSSGDGFSFSNYDADGNPGTVAGPGGTMTLAYDEMGRVTSIAGAGASTFRYDGDGRRVERTAGGATTRFLYDGETIVAELSGSNAVALYRTPGVGYVRGGAQRYEQDSGLGSLLTARDGSGSVVGQTEYDAYGREVWTGATTDRGDLRFAGAKGYVNDDATGMQMLGARYYLPVLGRFLTQDPIGHDGGLNLYGYCDNSPLMRVDPKGTQGVGDWVHRNVTRPIASWYHAYDTTMDFFMNGGEVDRSYGPGAWQTQDVMESAIGHQIASDLSGAAYLSSGTHTLKGSVGSFQAFKNSIWEFSNGTQWQVGAVSYYATRRGRVVDIHVLNTISFNSWLYHLPGKIGIGEHERGDVGWWGDSNIYQDFHWSVPVPSQYWKGMKR